MIRVDELREIAAVRRLSLENAEKDYLLDLLLFHIYGEFGDTLVLKGGTAMYKLYSLNRFSEDLDFTLNRRRFDANGFVAKMLRLLALAGVEGKVREIGRFGTETNIRLAFRGPLYSGGRESLCHVTLNISQRERVQRSAKRELVMPVSREVPSFHVFVMDEAEILAEKVRAVMTRNKPRDVYDIWFLLKRGTRPDVGLIDRKLKIYGKRFSVTQFEKNVEEKRAFWKTDLRGLIMGDLPDFDMIKNGVMTGFAAETGEK